MAITDRRGVSVSAVDTPVAGDPNPGLAIKAPALVATTGNITLSGLQTIDGVPVAAGNRVLVWRQTDATTNGLYNVSSGNWTRTVDLDGNDEIASGLQVLASSGTIYGHTPFYVATADPIAIGSTPITFAIASAISSRLINTTAPLQGGGDLSADRTLSLQINGSLQVTGGQLAVAPLAGVSHQWVSSFSAAGVPQLSQPTVADIANGAALTSTNDTNVTVTLGGGAAAALLSASSITLGWSGTLGIARGGTGQATAAAAFNALAPTTTRGDLIARGALSNVSLPIGTSGYGLFSNGTDPAWIGYTQGGAGAATRTWQSRLQDSVSILDFGAVADGSTAYSGTNAAANATALMNALATGKNVLIPYNANGYSFAGNTIVLAAGQAIIGENQVLLKSQPAANGYFIHMTAFENITAPAAIDNLKIDLTGAGAATTAIRFATASGVVAGVQISRIIFTNCVEAIGDEPSASHYVVDVKLYDIRCILTLGRQLYFRRLRGFIWIDTFRIDETANTPPTNWVGAQFDDLSGLEINRFDRVGPVATTYNSAAYALSINGVTGGQSSVWLNRILIDNTTGDGILLNNLQYVNANWIEAFQNLGNGIVMSQVVNSQFSNVFTYGAIGLTGAAAGATNLSMTSCSNCMFSNVWLNGSIGNGLVLNNSNDNAFSNVVATGNTGTAIVEVGSANKNLISNADFSGNGADVSLLGAASQIISYVSGGAYNGALVPFALSSGGTGASTASGARTNLGLGTAATQNTGSSGANIPFLNGNNTWSGTNAFNGGFSTGASTPPNLITGIAGGAPQAAGTTDANQFLTAGNGTVQWRVGFYNSGAMWSQPSLQSNYAANVGTVFNPNGGNVSIGGTTSAPATPYSNTGGATLLTVGGPIATSVPLTKTANYSQAATDSSLIFNGAGSITLTLISASTVPGQWLYVKTIANQTVVSAASNVVPLAGGAAGTAILAGTAGKWALLQSDGTNWITMAGN